MKDKSKSIQWFGPTKVGGPQIGFSKVVQQDGVWMTSRGSALQSSWIEKDVKQGGILGETGGIGPWRSL